MSLHRRAQNTPPTLRATVLSVPGAPAHILLHATVAAPPASAIAVVLDLSDSCATMHHEMSRLARLFDGLPRAWPLWFYRLSSPIALDQRGSFTIGQLQDDAVPIERWTSNRQIIDQAHTRGSLLRPVVEAIEQRAADESVESVTVLVLTDGELLDSTALTLPRAIGLVGLAGRIEPARQAHWKRVTGLPLYTLADPRLDDALRVGTDAFYGRCLFEFQTPQMSMPISIRRLHPILGQTIEEAVDHVECDLSAGNALLLLGLEPQRFEQTTIRCTPLKTKSPIVLPTPRADAAMEAKLLRAVVANLRQHASSEAEVLCDWTADAEHFEKAWSSFQQAVLLSQQRQPWVDANRSMLAFQDDCFRDVVYSGDRRGSADAILCLSNTDPASAPAANTRVLLIALSKQHVPALKWTAQSPPSFGVPAESIAIGYQRSEFAWMIQFGDDKPIELGLDGSEQITRPLLRSDGRDWIGLFSGDLR